MEAYSLSQSNKNLSNVWSLFYKWSQRSEHFFNQSEKL